MLRSLMPTLPAVRTKRSNSWRAQMRSWPWPRRRPSRRYSVEAIRQRAAEAGVQAQFDRFLEIVREAGLHPRPYALAVMIAPPANRTRYLMYARPEAGGIVFSAGPEGFAEFFPPLTEDEAMVAIGPYEHPAPHLAGAELDARLDQIEAFLKTLPPPDAESE